MTEFLCVLDYGKGHQGHVHVGAETPTQAAEKAVREAGAPDRETRVLVRTLGPRTFYKVTCELTATEEADGFFRDEAKS